MSFILADALKKPELVAGFSNRQWEDLIAQARSTGLLGSLHAQLASAGVLDQLPQTISRHLDSAWLVHTKTKADVNYEVGHLLKALAPVDERVILLKGAAYLHSGLPAGSGRRLTDIDILAPESRISAVEAALTEAGWQGSELDTYDERYYREWMHEIPPLTHARRGSTIDLHHTILPPTAAPNVDAALLFQDLVEITPGVFRLSDPDLVLHSATHLFHEGEFFNGLRDLWDLDQLLRYFVGADTGFWPRLVDRAGQLDLSVSLHHGLTYTSKIFDTPVPAEVMEQLASPMQKLRQPLMDFLFLRALRPNHPDCNLPLTRPALFALYIRSHYLRMPLYLLVPHLLKKHRMRSRKSEEATAQGAE
jgi:hypothetical protein